MLTLHLGKIGGGKIAELIVHTFVKTVVQDLIMALFGAFPKKTAVGAERVKFKVPDLKSGSSLFNKIFSPPNVLSL